MYQYEITVKYENGDTETVRTDHRDQRKVDLWVLNRGLKFPNGGNLRGSAPDTWVTVLAWCALQRTTGRDIEWSPWEATVVDIVNFQDLTPDPTQPGTQETPSPE